jgi:hypothetical protein
VMTLAPIVNLEAERAELVQHYTTLIHGSEFEQRLAHREMENWGWRYAAFLICPDLKGTPPESQPPDQTGPDGSRVGRRSQRPKLSLAEKRTP